MTYLIDSDYVADYLGAHQHATTLLSSLVDEGLAVSLITIGEIYEGIYYGRNPHKAEAVFRQFLRSTNMLPPTKSIMHLFAHLRGELRRTGQIIGDFDILIAATAIHHNLALVTETSRIISVYHSFVCIHEFCLTGDF